MITIDLLLAFIAGWLTCYLYAKWKRKDTLRLRSGTASTPQPLPAPSLQIDDLQRLHGELKTNLKALGHRRQLNNYLHLDHFKSGHC